MSDPMTNIDADDVLASIRRLVAETHGQSGPRGSLAMRNSSASSTKSTTPRPDVLALLQEAMMGRSEDRDETSHAAPEAPREDRAEAEISGHADGAAAEPAEALVLTPDFRVAQRDTASDIAADEPFVLVPELAVQSADTPEAPFVLDKAFLADTEAEGEFAGSDLAESEPAAGEPVECGGVAGAGEAESSETAAEDAAGAAFGDDWAPTLNDTPDEAAAAEAARLTLEQRIAALETAVGAQSMEWEPDGSEDLDAEIPCEIPRGFAESEARVLHFRAREESEAAMSQADESDDIDDAEVIEETPAEHVQHDAAAEHVESVREMLGADAPGDISRPSGADDIDAEFEDVPPDMPEGDGADAAQADMETEPGAAASDAQAQEEEPRADPKPEPEIAHDPDPSLEEELALAGYADEDIMDEDALRDLVAQVIREELQGEMGERITRNLRRLVRREVQRALTLREFE